jgi:uracil-DNA glycosylase
MVLTVKNYPYDNWGVYFNNHKVNMKVLDFDQSWEKVILLEFEKPYFKKLERYLSKCLEKTDGTAKFYPFPELLFNAFYHTPLDKVRVVILGQDPYHQCDIHQKVHVPQAMGLSFSVPVGTKIPSSLMSIYRNQLKFGHINKIPDHGNLESWASQGCLMLNTSLSVQEGAPMSHMKYWEEFTDTIIRYISDNLKDVIFVLWGGPALNKLKVIDQNRHNILVSSHPSGLSCHKGLQHYPAFVNFDHFGQINDILVKKGEARIEWAL